MTTATASSPRSSGKALNVGLWTAQVVAGTGFALAGVTKLTTPIAKLSAMMPWTGAVSEGFVRFIGVVDLAGGIGLILPAITRIQPRLTVLAALGCVVLQLLAAAFHTSRGEFAMLPVNALLLSLSAFILWGRNTRVPIAPRG